MPSTAKAAGTLPNDPFRPLLHLPPGTDPVPAHHDYIDAADMPACWRGLEITVEVEAKAKELAVARLMKDLAG